MKVREIMSTPVYIIGSEEPISRARNLMLKYNISRLVVIKEKLSEEASSKSSEAIPIGIVTKADISQRLDQAEPMWRRRPIDNIPISVIMTHDPVTIHPEATPKQAAELLLENKISGIPVVKSESDNNVIGIITKLDLIRYYSTLENNSGVKDIMNDFFVTVHRHHSICHVIHEMKNNDVDRVIVIDDNNKPVGTITTTNLALHKMTNPKGGLPIKDVKMARKNRDGGERTFRSIKEVSIVAEDVMSEPIITLDENSKAVEAAKIMVDERINGIPIVNNEIIGIVNAQKIIAEIAEI